MGLFLSSSRRDEDDDDLHSLSSIGTTPKPTRAYKRVQEISYDESQFETSFLAQPSVGLQMRHHANTRYSILSNGSPLKTNFGGYYYYE